MKYTNLGSTGVKVSRICLGCMSYGDPNIPNQAWSLNERDSLPFYKQAIEAGINFFDTANIYSLGASEVITGKALKEFATAHHVGPGWLFLTGKPDEVEGLRRKLGFVDPDPIVDRDTSQHIGVVRVGNDAIGSWTACPALSAPTQIARVIGWMDVPKTRGT